jgi:hypothetical protein
MLALVGARFGAIFGVMLNRAEWPGAAVDSSQTRIGKTKISWYAPAERHEAVLLCEQSRRLTLLVLPPDTPEQIALTAALMACAPGNAAYDERNIGPRSIRGAAAALRHGAKRSFRAATRRTPADDRR